MLTLYPAVNGTQVMRATTRNVCVLYHTIFNTKTSCLIRRYVLGNYFAVCAFE